MFGRREILLLIPHTVDAFLAERGLHSLCTGSTHTRQRVYLKRVQSVCGTHLGALPKLDNLLVHFVEEKREDMLAHHDPLVHSSPLEVEDEGIVEGILKEVVLLPFVALFEPACARSEGVPQRRERRAPEALLDPPLQEGVGSQVRFLCTERHTVRSAVRAVANGKGGRWASRGGVDLIESNVFAPEPLRLGIGLAEHVPMGRLPVDELVLPHPATRRAVRHEAVEGDGSICRQREGRESR